MAWFSWFVEFIFNEFLLIQKKVLIIVECKLVYSYKLFFSVIIFFFLILKFVVFFFQGFLYGSVFIFYYYIGYLINFLFFVFEEIKFRNFSDKYVLGELGICYKSIIRGFFKGNKCCKNRILFILLFLIFNVVDFQLVVFLIRLKILIFF